MSRFPLLRSILCLVFSAILQGQTQAPFRLGHPVSANPNSSGWKVDPGLGALRISLPIGTMPGEIPISLATVMGGLYKVDRYAAIPAFDHGHPIFGTCGFGYIGYTYSDNSWVETIALEDGTMVSASEFNSCEALPYVPKIQSLLNSWNLASDPDIYHTWYTISVDGSKVLGCLLNPTTFRYAAVLAAQTNPNPCATGTPGKYKFLADKNLLRVYVGAYPVLIADRFGHWVSIQWQQVNTNLPTGITSIVRVDALNQRGQGITLRYANWSDPNVVQDLMKVDYVGCSGPSALISGYSGFALNPPSALSLLPNPSPYGGLVNSVPDILGGMSARPTRQVVGNPQTVPEPAWGSLAPGTPLVPFLGNGFGPLLNVSPRIWNITYDPNQAEITSLADPNGVLTTFLYQNQSLMTLNPDVPTTVMRSVESAIETDTSGCQSPAANRTRTWSRSLPTTSNPAWTVTAQDYWDRVGPADSSMVYSFAPSSWPQDYANGFLQSVSLLDLSGNPWSTTAYLSTNPGGWQWNGGGLDYSLSFPQSVTTTRQGENSNLIKYSYKDITDFQVSIITKQVNVGGTFQTYQTQNITYNDTSAMLEYQQVSQVVVQVSSLIELGPPPPITTTSDWDKNSPPLLQLKDTYLGSSNSPYQHGQTFDYTSDGKVQAQGIWHVENGNTLPSPYSINIQYDPGTGQPALQTTSYFEVPGPGNSSILQPSANYDGANRATLLTDEKGVQTTLGYDLFGRVTSSTTSGLAPITTTYSTTSPWTVTQTQAGRITTSHLDGFGRIISQDLPDGTHCKYGYDLHGRLSSTTKVCSGSAGTAITSSTIYDLLGRPRSQTGFDGVQVTFTYTAAVNGNNQVVRSYNGVYPTTTLINPLGQVVQVTAPNSDTTIYMRDAWGHSKSIGVFPAQGGSVEWRGFGYDALGRLTVTNEPETMFQTFQNFNALNQPTLITEGFSSSAPRSRTLALDGLGRVRSVSANASGLSAAQSFTYAGANLTDSTYTVAGAATSTVTQHFDYFPATQGAFLQDEITTQAGQTSVIQYSYTNLGAIGSITYPSLRLVTYGFDSIGRATNVTSSLNGVTQVIVSPPPTSPFDVWGNRASLVFQSGAMDIWNPDATHARRGSLNVLPPGGNPLGWVYSYEAATGRLNSTGEWTIQNDSLGRLTHANQNWTLGSGLLTQNLSPDAFGNNASATDSGVLPPSINPFTFTSPMLNNQLLGIASPTGGTSGAVYNPYGELLVVETGVSSNQNLTMIWDPLGHLASVNESQTGDTQSYQYTAFGMRVARVDGLDPIQNRYYAYASGGQLLTESSQTNAAQDIKGVSSSGVTYGPTTSTHSGLQALRMWHQAGTNSSLSHFLGSFQHGDTLTITVWVNAPTGTIAQVFLGNIDGATPYDNAQWAYVLGTGTWYPVNMVQPVSKGTGSRNMWVFVYGNTNVAAPNGTFTLVDDVSVTSAMNPALNFSDGFETGLTLVGSMYGAGWWPQTSPTGFDVVTASSSKTFSGQGAVCIYHNNATNSSLGRFLGNFQHGDTLTATVWVNAPVGTMGRLFVGNIDGPTPYDNASLADVYGTGTWQPITVVQPITTNTGPRNMWVYIYGNTNNNETNGTFTYCDEVVVANNGGIVFRDGFDSGLKLATNGLYDQTGWNSAGEATQALSNLVTRDVIYLDGRAIAEIDVNGLHELHNDHLGTPRLTTYGGGGSQGNQPTVGAVEGNQTFGPYGEFLYGTGYVPLTGYTGHLQTEPNGLIYMKGRFYSPAWHCFLNSDQGADPSQLNQYAYAGGNPFTATDPTGNRRRRAAGHALGTRARAMDDDLPIDDSGGDGGYGDGEFSGYDGSGDPNYGDPGYMGGYTPPPPPPTQRLTLGQAGSSGSANVDSLYGQNGSNPGNAGDSGQQTSQTDSQLQGQSSLSPEFRAYMNAHPFNLGNEAMKYFGVAGILAPASAWSTTALPQTGSVLNVATDVAATEAQSNLIANGYRIVQQGVSSNGPYAVLSNGTTNYTIYTATSTGASSMQVTGVAGIIQKIRLMWGF